MCTNGEANGLPRKSTQGSSMSSPRGASVTALMKPWVLCELPHGPKMKEAVPSFGFDPGGDAHVKYNREINLGFYLPHMTQKWAKEMAKLFVKTCLKSLRAFGANFIQPFKLCSEHMWWRGIEAFKT